METKYLYPYRFKAFFKDGTDFLQTEDDVSPSDPKKSSFYDVEQRHDDLEILALGGTENPHAFAVNIRNGQFEANGALFTIHPCTLAHKIIPESVRVIYERTVRQHREITQNESGELVSTKDTTELVSFHLGWSCNDTDGNFHRFVLEIPVGE